MNSIYVVIFSLLLFPVLGLALGYVTRNYPLVRRCILLPVFAIGMVAIIAGLFGFSTIHTNIDFLLYSSLYLSLSLGLWYIFFTKSKILAAILMFVLYGFGYIFSLTLPLSGDIIPKVVLRLDENTIYKETIVPAEYAGKQIEIFKVYYNFFEKRTQIKTYLDDAPAFVNDTLALDYRIDEGKLYLSIPSDESKFMYTFHEKFDIAWKDTFQIVK